MVSRSDGHHRTKTESEVKEKGEAQAPRHSQDCVFGYLQMGDKRLAIINGMEYEPAMS